MTLDYYNNGGGKQVPLSIVTLTFDWNHLYFTYRSEKFDMGGLTSFPYQTVTCNQNETKTAEP
jgi:hypothetical protein